MNKYKIYKLKNKHIQNKKHYISNYSKILIKKNK